VLRSFVVVVIFAVFAAGCVGGRTVVPVSFETATLASPVSMDLSSHEATVRGIASILVRDLGLPVPQQVTVYVYSTRDVFEQGLVDDGRVSRVRAAELSDFAIGVGKRRQLLLHRESSIGTVEWVRLLAHELAHVSQIELAEGEGRAEQWLAEGMAEWIAFRVLERLQLDTFVRRRILAVELIRDHEPVRSGRLDLDTLGTPRGFTLRHLREGSQATYQLAFVLTDYLIAREGFDRVVRYFESFARRGDRRSNFAAAFGQSLEEFEHEAIAHLAATTR
jgi:hypothetical protein